MPLFCVFCPYPEMAPKVLKLHRKCNFSVKNWSISWSSSCRWLNVSDLGRKCHFSVEYLLQTESFLFGWSPCRIAQKMPLFCVFCPYPEMAPKVLKLHRKCNFSVENWSISWSSPCRWLNVSDLGRKCNFSVEYLLKMSLICVRLKSL